MKAPKLDQLPLILLLGMLLSFPNSRASATPSNHSTYPFVGNWALILPDGHAAWLSFSITDDKFKGEIWTVGASNRITEIRQVEDTLYFKRRCAVGDPQYPGGAPSGEKVFVQNRARVKGDSIHLIMDRPLADGTFEQQHFHGKRLPPLPPKPDLSKVKFGDPIELFNGKDLKGWRLTNPNQRNGWKAEHGELVNETPKLSFDPFSHYGNLRTDREFTDFKLSLEFNVPPKGNSGIYLRGMYEVQVVDRDSKMQGIQGVGSLFGRIKASENAGRVGGEWQRYEITLVDRHVTVVLNGKKVIDNQAIIGATKGALHADDTQPGPIYLQGDHTAVRYRNIVVCPVIEKEAFGTLDKNKDGMLGMLEIPALSPDVFDHVDRNVDRQLNSKEYKAYHNFKKRITQEKELIPQDIVVYKDVPYVENGHERHKLDLYLPKAVDPDKPLPLVIWVHGGGWQRGTKRLFGKQAFLLENGFAMASINYRLTRHAAFPAQLFDCKAAIRYLRKHAAEYGIDPDRFGLWGSSAGGHWVSLIGTTEGIAELEGNLGATDVSSKVDAICDWFGVTDITIRPSSVANKKLLGGLVEEKMETAKQASPLYYVSADDPPFLIIHGEKDRIVPVEQSDVFYQALKNVGVSVELKIVKDAGHAFFKEPSVLQAVTDFFRTQLVEKQ